MTPTRIPRFLGIAAAVVGALAISAVPPQESWRQASRQYGLAFPRDHASHPDYRIEWWYYTGNLGSEDGRRYGYQLTFFRIGIDFKPENPSKWAVRDLYVAHLAITDIDAGAHFFGERINRAGPGWAGAETEYFRVWNEGWEARLDSGERHILQARNDQIGVDLTLRAEKGPVLHGESGFSRKGSNEGNASHYYSMTRMSTIGRLWIDGAWITVEGLSWMDHEFGTSFLEEEQVGWDWFSVQLEDGTELMLFQLRRSDGSRDPHSSGTLVLADGGTTAIASQQFQLIPQRRWRSPQSDAEYPVDWVIRIPQHELELAVQAAWDDQELRTERSTGVTYWEGAVEISGIRGDRPIRGHGYLEMTGYAGDSMGPLFK